jgi:hypothetical protein
MNPAPPVTTHLFMVQFPDLGFYMTERVDSNFLGPRGKIESFEGDPPLISPAFEDLK